MYWCSLKLLAATAVTLGVLLLCGLSACRPDVKANGAGLKYFDIKGYFTAQATYLTKLDKKVAKTVSHNGNKETKTVSISNWEQEFDLFTASDINKPAWKDSYTVTDETPFLMYTAKYPDLKTREILVKKDQQHISYIMIFNYTKNMLYQNSEVLTYYPDSLYLIRKEQAVKLLGRNIYGIKAFIGK